MKENYVYYSQVWDQILIGSGRLSPFYTGSYIYYNQFGFPFHLKLHVVELGEL